MGPELDLIVDVFQDLVETPANASQNMFEIVDVQPEA